jgi:hypothetical protein
MTIPQYPFRSQWQLIGVDVVGYHLVDTIETAALEAIHTFYDQHPAKVAEHPIGLFPAIDSSDPEWNFRIAHYGHMLGDLAKQTLRGTIRFMNAQHHYQILLRRGMSLLTGIAQGHYRNADRRVTQIEELQALVMEKEEIIVERNEIIVHREDQINESDAIITQHKTIIEFLQEQVHDLILEVDDALAHIDELQQQPAPPAVPEAPEGEEEEPKEIEGVSDLDSKHGNLEPNPQPDHSSSGSQSSLGDLDDFKSIQIVDLSDVISVECCDIGSE